MFDRKLYWTRIAAQKAQLDQQFPDDAVYLTSLNAAQRVVQASTDIAARCIVEGTHRLSSEPEIEEFQRQQQLLAAQSRPVAGIDSARELFAAIHAGRSKAR